MTQTSDSATPVIHIRDLSYSYKGSVEPALKSVSLTVYQGQCFGLLGPNGAGKTTLLSILTGILPVQNGVVEVADLPLSRSVEIKRLSAMVPQDFAFYPGLTGRENLDFFAGLYRLDRASRQARVDEAIGICQLGDVLDKQADTYSGGLKRRLNLAIGLLNKPRILYLDEPTVGIDAQSRKFILEAIKRLKGSGVTVVYTSHYMEEVQAICDEVAIVDHGQVVLQSSLANLLDEQEQLIDLSFRELPNAAQIDQLRTLGDCQLEGRRLRLRLNSKHLGFEDVMAGLRAAQLTPRQIQYGINRLEDVYLSITKHELRE